MNANARPSMMPLSIWHLLLKELTFILLFVVTAAGVVLCGGPKSFPRTSSIVQIMFYFLSFEISGKILIVSFLESYSI